jgi:hypothetical protein
MRGWLALALLLVAASCDRTFSTTKRELFHATVDGVDLVITAELHGWHTASHLGPNFQTMPARDDFAIYRATSAKRGGGKELGVFDTVDIETRAIVTPPNRAAGKTELASLTALTCPVTHGVAFQVKGEWRALFVLGDRVFDTKLDSKAGDCAALGSISPDQLAVAPGGATTCLALDDAGLRTAAIDCFFHGKESDLTPVAPLPKEGAIPYDDVAHLVKHGDRDALVARFASDPKVIDDMIARLATTPPPYDDIIFARERLLALDTAHALPRFIDRVTTECATACSDDVVKYGELAIGWKGTAFVTPDACEKGISFARTLAAKGDAAALKRAFFVLRGFYSCLDAVARPMLVSGLSVATSPEVKIGTPDAIAYSMVDSNCQPYTGNSGAEVSGLCESFPRFAGTWLANHCGPDAINAAKKIAHDRPRTPFDPREDQVLDGALRVLGACDKTAFETAIAHVPATNSSPADIRSQENLRAAFAKK